MTQLPKWLVSPLTSLFAGRDRLHHALLITGPEGVGKEWLARALANALLCDAPEAARLACGGCSGCRWFSQDSHPDFRLIRPAADEVSADDAEAPAKPAKASRDIRIEQIRALAGFVEIASHRGGAKVVLITPAEAMNGAAANALLKTLEEPPANTYFIMTSSRAYRLPPTVRSRCRQVPIPAPSTPEAVSWVIDQAGVDSDRALEWLAFCGGAPRRAVEFGTAERAATPRDLIGVVAGRGGEAVADEMPGEFRRGPAFRQQQMRDHQQPRFGRLAEFRQMPAQPHPLPDRAPGEVRHRAAVAAADVAAGAEEIIGDGIRRAPRRGFHRGEQID